jgi:hypothetical protein
MTGGWPLTAAGNPLRSNLRRGATSEEEQPQKRSNFRRGATSEEEQLQNPYDVRA